MKKLSFLAFIVIIGVLFVSCSKNDIKQEETEFESFIEFSGDKLVLATDITDCPAGTVAYYYYNTPDSEPQVLLFPDENSSNKDLPIEINCDRLLIQEGNWIDCDEEGSTCRVYSTSGGGVYIYVCNPAVFWY